jgi:hypothetical protein
MYAMAKTLLPFLELPRSWSAKRAGRAFFRLTLAAGRVLLYGQCVAVVCRQLPLAA